MTRAVLLFILMMSTMSWADVSAREETITMPTWEVGAPQVHSIFYDAGGRKGQKAIYPYTLKDVLTDRKVDKQYKAVILENEYIQIVVLPEIGGRLHGATDKSNKYAWLYTQKTIKPGLIGMTGAWISGGIEWNFPHGHRPSAFSTVDHRLVRNADGSATVWVGETEPIYRVRWLVGMTVFPGRSYVRCEYVFINPTDVRAPFMFWATAATHANEWSQAQYPGDMVTGHGKQEFWNWPIHNGVDLTWWKNSPNASSYFAFNNPSDWFGTYDHRAQAGMVHVANHEVMPGKKLWTWGSGPSGRIWEDILTEGGGAYFEPQAGAWSDNQPDYQWIHPHEVKRTHDYWYPVRDTRGYHNANTDFAVNTDLKDGSAFGAVYATAIAKDQRVVLKNVKTGAVLSDARATIAPDKPYTVSVKASEGTTVYDLHLAVYDSGGGPRIEVQQMPPKKVDLPPALKEPGDPKKLNQDELYRAGEWLELFIRTDEALEYYRAGLAADPKDSRINTALGYLALTEGRWNDALKQFDIALERDSSSARLFYGKALAQAGLGKTDESYGLFYRASYGHDYYAPAYFNLARIDLMRGDAQGAIEKVTEAEQHNSRFADIPALKAAALRRLGRHKEALAASESAMLLDVLHAMGGREKLLAMRSLKNPSAAEWERVWKSSLRDDSQNYLELATAYGNAGLYADADEVLAAAGKHPMVSYLRGYYRQRSGDRKSALDFYREGSGGRVDYTNPHRLEEAAALEAALKAQPDDANARLFLGNLLYAKHRREEAFQHWGRAAELNAKSVHALRNVAYAQRYLSNDLKGAYASYTKALAVAPTDARVLLELDQIAELLNVEPASRFTTMSSHIETVRARDDLMARMVDLRIQAGDRPNLQKAYEDLKAHHFHSWEGRYGIHLAWVDVNQRLGDLALKDGDKATALRHYQEAGEYPKNLEVAPRTPDFRAHVYWNLAKAHAALGQTEQRDSYIEKILAEKYGRAHLGVYYKALAQKAKGDTTGYKESLAAIEKRARDLTSGTFEHRGDPEAIGHYLMALVLSEQGNNVEAAASRAQAVKSDWRIDRAALLEAQLDVARAHQ